MNNTDLAKKIKQLVHSTTYQKGYVCSVDILLGLGVLSKDDYDSWRAGKIEYLENVCRTNLHKLSSINSTLKAQANALALERSPTFYKKYGRGPKVQLRFSKSGNDKIEEAYATHYLDKQRIFERKKKEHDD